MLALEPDPALAWSLDGGEAPLRSGATPIVEHATSRTLSVIKSARIHVPRHALGLSPALVDVTMPSPSARDTPASATADQFATVTHRQRLD